jgi:hypothetical protein
VGLKGYKKLFIYIILFVTSDKHFPKN